METILITGINGFLGSKIAKELCINYNIIGLEYSTENLFRINSLNFKVYSYTTNSIDLIFEENRVDYIIHAATVYGRRNDLYSDIIQTNILMPIRLIELANIYQTLAFINIDSFFNDPSINYKYLSEYTFSKRNFIEWISLMQSHVKVVSLKIFHLYGPNDNKDKFVASIIEDLLSGKKAIDLTPGQQMRDFVYIDDVIKAFKIVLKNISMIKTNFSSIDIGSGVSVSIEEFVTTAKKLTKASTVLNFGAIPYRDGEIMHAKADIRKLSNFGWQPEVNVEQGIAKIINSFKQ